MNVCKYNCMIISKLLTKEFNLFEPNSIKMSGYILKLRL